MELTTDSRATGFLERWLLAHDLPPAEVARASAAIRARASRYPFPVNRAFPALITWLDRVAPALLLKKLGPAHALDADAFDRLEHALQHHPSLLVRAAYTLARYPGFDQLYPDEAPPSAAHPLHARAAALELGASHLRGELDVVVIGSGAGGAPVAWSLARRGLRVAIVEAGAIVGSHTAGDAVERAYLEQGMTGSMTPDNMTLLLAGKAVGGTTVINSGTSLRPLRGCLDGWDAGLGTSFGGGALDPWLEAASRQVGVTTPPRELLQESAAIVERGLAALGRGGAYVLPRNAPDCKGAGRCCFGCPTGAKMSTDRSFLPDAIDHGAVLLMETRATAIREHAGGVEVFVTGRAGRRTLRARHVVIAAGALGTPALLKQNRLGARWREAGQHLKLHPASKVFGLMPGPVTHGGVPQGLGYKPDELPRVTFEGIHTPAAAAAPMVSAAGRRHRWWMERYDRLATFGLMIRDRAVGSVAEVGGRPLVRYALDRDDARDVGAGLKLVAEALFAAGAERILLPVTGVNPEVESLAALRALPDDHFRRDRLMTCGFHPQGTAGMGRVVDADLRVEGSRRVHVSDASVMPDSPGVNPQVTIMALALRLADRLAAEARA